MSSPSLASPYDKYEQLIVRLKGIIQVSQARVIQEPVDTFLITNMNFFVKAYLVSLCTYLEAFLQDLVFEYVKVIQSRVASVNVPSNAVRWLLTRELKDKDARYENFSLSISRKELSDELSGNPGKTIVLFRNVGVDLRASDAFEVQKDVVGAVVAKRNNIVHHNDSAADISITDLLNYADQFLKYMSAVSAAVQWASSDGDAALSR